MEITNKEFNMNKATYADINDAIVFFTNSARMFTAYDITKTLRHMHFIVLHADVKYVLSQAQIPTDYQKSYNKQVGAFVYHPNSTSPHQYDKDEVPEFDVASNPAQAPSAPVVNTLFDNRQRFTLTSKYVKDAGIDTYSPVHFSISQNQIEVETCDIQDKHATVDHHWNVRIPKRVFDVAFGSNVPTEADLKIKTDGSKVVLYI